MTSSLGKVALIESEIRSLSSSTPRILTLTCWPGSSFHLENRCVYGLFLKYGLILEHLVLLQQRHQKQLILQLYLR